MDYGHHREELRCYREALMNSSIDEQRTVLLVLLRLLEEEQNARRDRWTGHAINKTGW